jgi:two-component system OmpR family response regulator
MTLATVQPVGRSRPRIVVVEDDLAVLDLVTTRLEIAGYETRRARDGAAAVERLGEFRPSAMILDLNLPKLDGFGVLDILAHRPDLAKVPVLVLSARNSLSDIKLAIAMGASDFLTKPFETTRLLSRVARLLRRPPGPSAPSGADNDPFLL